jgi:hypothetical protein
MLKYQVSFSAIPPEQEDERYRQRLLHNLQPKAQKLGAKELRKNNLIIY